MTPSPVPTARPRPRPTRSRARLAALVLSIAALAGTTGGCGGGDEPAPPGPARPPASVRPTRPTSLVLVDVSGVRYEEVEATSRDGAPASSAMPAFLGLAGEGTFFTQAVSPASWDVPAIVGLLTGNLPSECAIRGRPGADGPSLIPAIPTLAQMLSDGGYATGGFTAGGRVTSAARLDKRFDAWGETDDDATRLSLAKAWLATVEPGRPRFLFLHANVGGRTGAARAQRLAALDAWLRDARDLARGVTTKDGVWFVALSDHGDVLTEREGVPATGEAGVLDAQIRVPLAAVGPGFPAGRLDASVGLVDLVATVRDRLGLEPWATIEGRTWAPLLSGTPGAGRPIHAEAWRRVPTKEGGQADLSIYAVRLPGAKYVARFDDHTGKTEQTLFDLAADPTETREAGDANDLARFGPAFVSAVESVRAVLTQGQRLRADPNAHGYFGEPPPPPRPKDATPPAGMDR